MMNVWIAPIGKLDVARAVTRETKRGLQSCFWAPRDLLTRDPVEWFDWHLGRPRR
jgi:hypothetical protein